MLSLFRTRTKRTNFDIYQKETFNSFPSQLTTNKFFDEVRRLTKHRTKRRRKIPNLISKQKKKSYRLYIAATIKRLTACRTERDPFYWDRIRYEGDRSAVKIQFADRKRRSICVFTRLRYVYEPPLWVSPVGAEASARQTSRRSEREDSAALIQF